MRYPDDHKEKTHQRIIDEAARRFRQDGVGATGLQPLMKALGLTHGGFYAHFKSKDALVEAALRRASEEANANAAAAFSDDGSLKTFIAAYLSSIHREKPETGCPLPTVAAELGQKGKPSAVTDELVESRLQEIAGTLTDDDADDQAVLLFSALVGALTLSRSVSDPALSDRLLKTTRRLLTERYVQSGD